MKRTAILIAMLGMLVWGLEQYAFAQSNAKGAAQSAPAGKRMPQAKTQEEYAAFNAAAALTDAAALEKAAGDFATKFPNSELRPMLYKSAMFAYLQANNTDKAMEMAQKILSFDADDPDALVNLAQVMVDRTRDTDLDRDQRLAEARKDAQRALVTVETDVPTLGVAPEKVKIIKANVFSEAYYVLGEIDYTNKAWADAEGNFRKSIEALPQSVDPGTVLNVALALDMQDKYPEALKYAGQAVDLTKEGTGIGDRARNERDRLTKLTGGSTPPAATPPKN
jgi:tetratricopeptide (TPR) repeat protein